MIFSGCATLKVPPDQIYPFRAAFEGSAVIAGESMSFEGALSINSREHGFAQVYGPGGLAAYSVDVTQGEVRLLDMWGRLAGRYSIPLDQFLGLMAGAPPDMRYLWRSSFDGGESITYTWGTLATNGNLLPRELYVRGDPPLDVRFIQDGKTITLLMNLCSDRLRLTLDVIAGGRWMSQPFTN